MMKYRDRIFRSLFCIIIHGILFTPLVEAQFAPQAIQPGSTAMHKDSSAFIAWACSPTLNRGWLNYTDTSAGKTSLGDESKACGKADGDVVSLGDFGTLTYFFENPVVDGPGFDFAIFENGFINPADSFQAYLELAKVSVSNDGVHFYTFPSQCDQDTLIQVAGFGDFMDARKINNLAGKYILNFGTPFDLSVFSALSSLDCNNIRFIRIEDIAGSIDPETGSRDALQHLINDPFPTPFPGGGFDLDAVGIIHQKFPVQVQDDSYTSSANWYPNPCNGHLFYQKNKIPDQVEAWTLYGQKIPVSELANGEIQIPYHGLVLLQWNENGIVHHQWIHCL